MFWVNKFSKTSLLRGNWMCRPRSCIWILLAASGLSSLEASSGLFFFLFLLSSNLSLLSRLVEHEQELCLIRKSMEHLFTLTLKTVAHQCLDLILIKVCHPTSDAWILVVFNRLLSLYQLFRLFLFLEILSKVCKVLGALLHHERLANVSIIAVTFEFSIRESQILQQS